MHQFYFNDCLPLESTSLNDLGLLLSKSIKEFNILIKKEIEIDKGIILERETESTIICKHNLKNIILSIPDNNREIRTLAFAYFTKYPIQYYLQSDEIEDNLLEEEYSFENVDATNIAIAKYHSCFLFSMAINDSLKKDTLKTQGKTTELCIDNLYGENLNTVYIESQIRKINAASLNLFDQLKAELNTPIYTSSFEKTFLSEKEEVQKAIIDMFVYARERGLVTPYFPDTKIIADVTPRDNKKKVKVYELRVYRPIALRVYFYEFENVVFIGKLGYKADYKEEDSNAQSKDIQKALNDIDKMIKTR